MIDRESRTNFYLQFDVLKEREQIWAGVTIQDESGHIDAPDFFPAGSMLSRHVDIPAWPQHGVSRVALRGEDFSWVNDPYSNLRVRVPSALAAQFEA